MCIRDSCKVNSYLKEVIGLLANSFDYVVIDGEAGIEQIQRLSLIHILLRGEINQRIDAAAVDIDRKVQVRTLTGFAQRGRCLLYTSINNIVI